MATDIEQRIERLREAADTALARAATASFTLISVTIYLVISGFATTPRDLLIGRSFQLPIFDVEGSLLPFYVLAPVVLVAAHIVALQLCAAAADRLRDLRGVLDAQGAAPEERQWIVRILYPSPLVDGIMGQSR